MRWDQRLQDHGCDNDVSSKGRRRYLNLSTNAPIFVARFSRRRIDLGGVLQWGEQSKFFHSVLDHPKLVPYYHEFCGKGYRMDHMPFCIVQNKGSEGFNLHGGTIDVSSGEYNHFLAYTYNHGQIRSNLLAVAVALCPHPEGGGGFCVVKGR